jgi:hypothetical protein
MIDTDVKIEEFNKIVRKAHEILGELYKTHDEKAPIVLTLALVAHCKGAGQDPHNHVDRGLQILALRERGSVS